MTQATNGVGMSGAADVDLAAEIKDILRRDLKLGAAAAVPDDMPLVGGDMDLDSLDILLLVSSLEKRFKIKIPSEVVGRWVFENVGTLTKFVGDNRERLSTTHFDAVDGGATDARVAPRTSDDWLAMLPHGPEFRFVSKVSDVVPGERAGGHWTVDGDEAFFKGHFPGRPIVPGVLVVEALAQMAGLAAACAGGGGAGVLTHADVHFESPVSPPAAIELRATVRAGNGTAATCDVVASLAGRVIARGAITLHLAPSKG